MWLFKHENTETVWQYGPVSKHFFFTSKQSALKINRHAMMSATDIGNDIDSDCEGDSGLIVDNDGEQK